MAAMPLVATPVTVKLGALAPSAASVKVRMPVALVSSAMVAERSPPKVPGSLTGVTVISISWVSTLPSSSVTETVKLSVPCQLAVGV